jgi:hypothetical protein
MSNEFLTKTCTSLFLVPLLGIQKVALDEMGFISGYLGDVSQEVQYDEAIYMLFKPEDQELFGLFVRNETNTNKRNLIDDYDYDGRYTVLVYQIPEKFISDYKLFLEGKYSEFSDAAKKMFPEETPVIVRGHREILPSFAYRVFNKEERMRKWIEDLLGVKLDKDAECWTKPNLEFEKLNIDKIKAKLDVQS